MGNAGGGGGVSNNPADGIDALEIQAVCTGMIERPDDQQPWD